MNKIIPSGLLFILLMITCTTFGQSQESFEKIVDETNEYLNIYSGLYPFDQYYSISDFNFSETEKNELLLETDRDWILTTNKDSVDAYYMIEFYQEKIMSNINRLVDHNRFKTNKIEKQLPEISIVASDDRKLFNFSIDGRSGGTYQSRISKMFVFEETKKSFLDITENSIFHGDGYHNIYTLENNGITKYLLSGYVRGCTSCFENYILLINSDLKEEFSYSTSSRDWKDGISYDHKTKTIDIFYYLDDLTSSCFCENEIEIEYNSEITTDIYETPLICSCQYVYNGKEFVLIKGSLEKE